MAAARNAGADWRKTEIFITWILLLTISNDGECYGVLVLSEGVNAAL